MFTVRHKLGESPFYLPSNANASFLPRCSCTFHINPAYFPLCLLITTVHKDKSNGMLLPR